VTRLSRRYVVAITAATITLATASTASAATDPTTGIVIDDEVAYALEMEPGGYATGEHTAYWPDLSMTLESSQAHAATPRAAVGSCASGSVCAYSGYGLAGSKLSWTTCGSHPTTALSSVKSIANARSSGTLQARNGTTVVASASAGGQANVTQPVTNVYC
jgi:hypothetical protein